MWDDIDIIESKIKPRLRTELDDVMIDPHTLSDGSWINLGLLFRASNKEFSFIFI